MKKILLLMMVFFSVFSLFSCANKENNIVYTKDDVSMNARTKDQSFQVYKDGEFEDVFLTGVNMGAALPGYFPGSLAISKEMYLTWFAMIHEMHADVIRVYTTQQPHFYEALYEFNQTVEDPLYLMHGVWLNETHIKEIEDAYGQDQKLLEDFLRDGQDLVDIIHGNAVLDKRPGFASGTYAYDVSRYVIGWILGVEWDITFVEQTNTNNVDKEYYQGVYLQNTEEASPFESFLAEVGDKIIEYEVDNYQYMRPLSFVNWPTTDHLEHPNEPDKKEDLLSVNMNHILATDNFYAGFFASFHVYPYYPEFMNYSIEYNNFIDHRGEENPYQGYLHDLIEHLNMPVFIAEFGVPASRGKTHENVTHGYNQGFLSEEEQGEINALLLEDIYESGSAGGFLFTWQDEWFKRTWNTMDLDLSLRRPFWSNVQTNEQNFGLLAFDPGEEKSTVYVDGNTDDWEGKAPLYSNPTLDLYTDFDERYVYIRIDTKQRSFQNQRLIIPIMTNSNQGNDHIVDSDISFSEQADFYIDIQGDTYGEMFVDAYYDPFYFLYHETLEMLPKNPSYTVKNSGIFNTIYQALSAELTLPQEDRVIPFSKHNTGRLTYGNGNPNSENYHSLSDYYIKDNILEIRIPWLMLNISDPSSKMRLADFYQYDWFVSEPINQIYIGAAFIDGPVTIPMMNTTWEAWEQPTYHMRLKESYEILKEAFYKYE